MKILIIGSGFLARPIIQHLESEGHTLKIYSKTKKAGIVSEQIIGNVFDFDDFIKVLLWKPQVIIQAAWITTHGNYKENPLNIEFKRFTTALAKNVVSLDLEHLIILGSCAEYGQQIVPSVAGQTRLAPDSLYAREKVETFSSCLEILSDSDVRLTWARIFQPYGKFQDENRLIPYLIKSLKNKMKIDLQDTSTVHDWVSTIDIALAISWIVNNNAPTEVDIGTSMGFTNIELLESLKNIMENSSPSETFTELYGKDRKMVVVGKNSPLFEYGWKPTLDLKSGLEWLLE